MATTTTTESEMSALKDQVDKPSEHMEDYLLTIAICSLPERMSDLQNMLTQLQLQSKDKPVEIISIIDNRSMSVGRKRQYLNEIAHGKYVVHVDDDDEIAQDFVDSLLKPIREDKYDCINYVVMVYVNDNPPKPCLYSKDFRYESLPDRNLRPPNSRCCYRRTIAIKHRYSDFPYAEDDDWGLRASKDIQTEYNIDKVLYHYRYREKGGEWFMTQKYRKMYVPKSSPSS